ncbi:hypothetical protein DFH09DRAFT_173394 [Mycena vulgaris]|nr:hypothetical protein DFH09DRAFT_173394 [Mycena vulgaris]
MLWAAILLFCSLTAVSAASNTITGKVDASTVVTAIGGDVGSIFAVQTETGDTRVIYQSLINNNIMQFNAVGPFVNTSSVTEPFLLVPGANVLRGTPIAGYIIGPAFTTYGFYFLSPNLTVTEWYWLASNGIHFGSGSACPDCINNFGFAASANTIGLYAMAKANGGRRVGFLSSDQSAIAEIDRAATGAPYILARLPPRSNN